MPHNRKKRSPAELETIEVTIDGKVHVMQALSVDDMVPARKMEFPDDHWGCGRCDTERYPGRGGQDVEVALLQVRANLRL